MNAFGLADTGIPINTKMIISASQHDQGNVEARPYNNGNNWGIATKTITDGSVALAGVNVTFRFLVYTL